MNKQYLADLKEKGLFSPLDIHFAGFISDLAGMDDPELFFAAALVSRCRGQGHVCLDLPSVQGKSLFAPDDAIESLVFPELGLWKSVLEKSHVVGSPGEYRPLILDDKSRIYLYRYWEYQEKLARLLNKRIQDNIGFKKKILDCVIGLNPRRRTICTTYEDSSLWPCQNVFLEAYSHSIDVQSLKEGLNRLFPKSATTKVDWQKIAALTALTRNFCVISGGPGTGKTTTVVKIIALILEQAGAEKVRIALVAPTGKAASRLQDSINSAKGGMKCSDNIKDSIPQEASTIHRLLGSIPGSPYFRHNADNPLPVDVVIVDEASMVDLALMSKLVQALPSQARLVLLGDKDQLASVEAGAVLGDICDSGNSHGFSEQFCKTVKAFAEYKLEVERDEGTGSGIGDCIVQLKESYRFGDNSGIGAVSRAVNAGNVKSSLKLLKDNANYDIKWKALPGPDALENAVKDAVISGFKDYLTANDPVFVFKLFERFKILCALRDGPYGVYSLNLLVERILIRAGLIDHDRAWYAGRPLLITKNDYNLRLFNGDVGIVLPDPDSNNDLRVYFSKSDGTMRKLHPLRLPEHETVYSMTIHKSQGSEFDKVLLLLPDRDYPVLTRELIYTGITRGRAHIEIWGKDDVFRAAVSRRTERTSGLRDALWASFTI